MSGLTRIGIHTLLLIGLVVSNARAESFNTDYFPIFPINFDVAIRQQSFAPDDREIGIQIGYTALRRGNLEVRHAYQYFSVHTEGGDTDQHSTFLNPRWNNFIDILDFPKSMPINRVIRHVLFGPLEDRAIPYIGAIGGIVFPGPGNGPGELYGGQIGVRFPVTRGIAVDFSMQYTEFKVEFNGQGGLAQQWIFLSGVRF